MESAAYYVAVVTVVAAPPAVCCWFLVHPFAEKWRRVGPLVTYVTVGALVALGMAGIYGIREPILRIRFGFSMTLLVPAAFLFGVAIYIEVQRHRVLRTSVLIGLPEISRQAGPGELVTQGIYSWIRHPRYLVGGLLISAAAFFSNYLAVYLLLFAYIPVIYAVVIFEERELKTRFGTTYEEYCRQVPRFVPRPRRGLHHLSL
jgi:protein-S-isoprenylcysteine O-methyltransferase Ste14